MEKVVDVKKAIRSSKSMFYRMMPNFAINRIKKIIHEDQLNQIHNKYAHLWGIDYVKALLFEEFKVKIDIIGEENVDKNEKYVYIANHPLGGIDALGFLYVIHKIHGNVVSPSNQLFEYIPNLSPLIVGINVFGHNDKKRAMAVNKAFESDNQIMIFPAGEVSRLINGKIQDPPWHKTFVTKAVQYKRDIVPVFITGRNSDKFYRTANIRKKLGVKLYVETLLLPAEMLQQYGYHLTFIIGEPISYKEIKNSGLSHIQWTEKIRKIVYGMGEKLNAIPESS